MTTDPDFLNQSLLVADDNPVNRRIVTMLLKGRLKKIDVAFNGEEALSKFMEKHYDIVLMDIHMPEMDGYESTAAIRLHESKQQDGKKSVIIAMTASEEVEVIPHCYHAGMDAYIGKPFLPEQFFDVLEKLKKG